MTSGPDLYRLAARLYPICRSITGAGVRESLAILRERVPLELREVPSGSRVFDWEVPLEWNIDGATLESPDGAKIADFRDHNLHLVGYSEPFDGDLSLTELQAHLHSMPERPAWIPYRTSYYQRNWGFCIPHARRRSLRPGRYRVRIRSSLTAGSLTYGEWFIRGRSRDEVLFFTHTCHPSLANDNVSGMAVAAGLAAWVAGEPRRWSYRFVFAPGTIGSLCWLKANERSLGRIKVGLVLCLLGDGSPLTYKRSREEHGFVDRVGEYLMAQVPTPGRVLEFSPYGYDERQFCSPGFDLPIGRLTRAVNGGYPEYHTSADDLTLITPGSLEESLAACREFVTVVEDDRHYVNRLPKGEPRLGKRGLYGPVGGTSPAEREQAMLWILNQADGSRSLLDIALRSGLSFGMISRAAADLERAGLLKAKKEASRRPRSGRARSPRTRGSR